MNTVKVILAIFPKQEVIRSLVKRYVAAMIRSAKTDEGLTEENFKVGA